MSAAADAPAPEAPPPTARLVTRRLVTRGIGHSFHVVVSSGAGLSPDTVGDGDVLVAGPRGFSAAADVTRVTSLDGGKRLLVSCFVAAPGGAYDRADNGVYRVSLRAGGVTDNAGAAATARFIGGFRVVARPLPAATPVLPPGTSAAAGALSVSFDRMAAWCDHMPGFKPEPDNREYLVISATLRNTSDQPLEVRLDRAYVSFDEDQVGAPTDGISVRSPDGPPTGQKTLVLQPGETRAIEFRGNGVYPEDHHDQRLYVTLQFSADGATAAVRNSAVVMMTW